MSRLSRKILPYVYIYNIYIIYIYILIIYLVYLSENPWNSEGFLDLSISISNTASRLRFYSGLKLMAYTDSYWVTEKS